MRARVGLAIVFVAGFLCPHALAREEPAQPARELVDKVIAAARTTGFRGRAKLIVTSGEKRDVKQLLIKGSNNGTTTRTLYQVLWPSDQKRAVLLEKAGNKPTTGYLYSSPGLMKPLTPALLSAPLFDSDLAIEDVTEDFWGWPARVAGEETVKDRRCQVITFKPPPSATTAYTMVKCWLSPDLLLPLAVEKYGKGGRLAKRITADRLVRESNRWVIATAIVEHGSSRTSIEGSKSDRDLDLSPAEFEPEAVLRALQSN
jgi:Outer membrane lipoprotein-sorting protein